MTDDDVRQAFRSVEQELERLRTQHVTTRKTVRIDPASVPLPDSDFSRSSSPGQHSKPSSAMQRARDSGHFSPEELRMFPNAVDASMSVPAQQKPARRLPVDSVLSYTPMTVRQNLSTRLSHDLKIFLLTFSGQRPNVYFICKIA